MLRATPWQANAPHSGSAKDLGVPLYHQIQHLLRHRIHSGLYPPGTQIPSEHELSRELAVSRVTLREALRELVRENLLVKVQGKGTFVASNPPKRLAPVRYTGFLEELQERVRKLRVTDVEVAQAPATADLRHALQLDAATSELTLIRRLRHIDDEPFSFTLNYLPTEIGARIRRQGSLLDAAPEDPPGGPEDSDHQRARETIEAAPADPDTARRLGIPVLYPVLHMTRVMYTTGDRPFELVDIYYRADKYHYSVNMTRVKRQGRWTWATEVETSA